MKNLKFLSFALLFAFLSCSKEKTIAPNTITAIISGTTETFAVRVQVTKNPGNPDGFEYGIGLTAFNADAVKADDIGVYVYSHSPIVAGTYKFAYPPSNANTSSSFLSYAVNPSDFDYIPDETKSDPSTIVITSMTSSNIQGTFSGTLKGTDDRAVTIVNGKFNVNY
jgi:hypothetical protein